MAKNGLIMAGNGGVIDNHGELSTQANAEVVESVEKQLVSFLVSRGVDVAEGDIEACHPLPIPANTKARLEKENKIVGPDPIIVRFVNRKSKVSLMKQWKRLQGTKVYLNDHLTKANAVLAARARQLRRDSKIKNTWTRDCNIYVQTNGPPEKSKILVIRSAADLSQLEKIKCG